jgi:hypothetical protein
LSNNSILKKFRERKPVVDLANSSIVCTTLEAVVSNLLVGNNYPTIQLLRFQLSTELSSAKKVKTKKKNLDPLQLQTSPAENRILIFPRSGLQI